MSILTEIRQRLIGFVETEHALQPRFGLRRAYLRIVETSKLAITIETGNNKPVTQKGLCQLCFLDGAVWLSSYNPA